MSTNLDKLVTLTACEDGSCCCLPPRSAIALISLLSLVACFAEKSICCQCEHCGGVWEHVDSMRHLLVKLFQMANMLLLTASLVENAHLVQLYVWYTLGFVVLGFIVAILDFVCRMRCEGPLYGFLSLATDVVFLFVLYRCLPVVDAYRKKLTGVYSIRI